MQTKLNDPKINARIEMLAATAQGKALEHALDQALSNFMAFFAQHGIGPLTATVNIERSQEAVEPPPCDWHQTQLLKYLSDAYRTANKPKARKNAAQMIEGALRNMVPSGREH